MRNFDYGELSDSEKLKLEFVKVDGIHWHIHDRNDDYLTFITDPGAELLVSNKDFPIADKTNVTRGQRGGMISKLDNVQGDSWVSADSKVFNDVVIKDNTLITKGSEVSGSLTLSNSVVVNSTVRGDAILNNCVIIDCVDVNLSGIYTDKRIVGATGDEPLRSDDDL